MRHSKIPQDIVTIGDIIRIKRIQKNLTQRQLGKMINTTDSYITHIEVGRKLPSLSIYAAIEKILGIDPAWRRVYVQQRYPDLLDWFIIKNPEPTITRAPGAEGQKTHLG